MALPTVLTTGDHVVLEVPGPSVLQKDTNAVILLHAPMKKQGHKFELEEGSTSDLNFGCFLRFPDRRRVQLWFEEDRSYLPVHAPR